MSRAVVAGELKFVSASQVSTFDPRGYGGCPRKWWYRYVGDRAEVEGPAQKLGTAVHAEIEAYLRGGPVEGLGPIARSGLRFIPRPGGDLVVEEKFGGGGAPTLRGVPFVGRIDLMHDRGERVDDDGEVRREEPGVVEVLDWKSSSRINAVLRADGSVATKRGRGGEEYPLVGLAKTPEEIASSVQMVSYAEVAAARYPRAERVRLGHGYFQTGAVRAAEKRSAVVTLEEVRSRWEAAGPVVAEMRDAARATDAASVTANYSACSAYRGCPHREVCPREVTGVLYSIFNAGRAPAKGAEMGLMDRIKARNDAAKGVAPPAPAPAPTPPRADVAAEKRKIVAEESLGRPCATCGTALTVDNLSVGPSLDVRHVGCPGGAAVLPPDAPKHDPKTASEPMTASELAAAPESVRAAHEAAHGAPAEEKKKKAAKAEPAKAEPARATGLRLYVDCSVDGEPTKSLESYLAPLCKKLADEFGAADVRCAPADSALGFGRWRGALAALVRTEPPEPGAWCAASGELADVAIEALYPACSLVVRGRR